MTRVMMVQMTQVKKKKMRMMRMKRMLMKMKVKLALMDDKGNAKVLTFGDRFRVKRDTSLFAEIKILFGPSSLPLA